VRDFTASAGRLRILSVPAKLLYSAFALSALLGLLVSWQLYGEIVADAGAVAYYAGAPVEVPKSALPSDGGPELDLPMEATQPRVMVEQVSSRKLLEVTHFHLFSIPVYVLILAHLWVLARLPSWLHGAGVAAAIVTSGLHMAAPWLVRSAPPLAWLMPVSGAAMLVVLGAMSIVPTVDMWLPPVRRGPKATDPDEA
jgi:hypothetical protein